MNISFRNDFVEEKSYIDFETTPVTGLIVANYNYYYKVRFAEDSLTRQLIAYQLLNTGMKLKEVRWDSYVPPAGNA